MWLRKESGRYLVVYTRMLNRYQIGPRFKRRLARGLIVLLLLHLFATGCQRSDDGRQIAGEPIVLHDQQQEYLLGPYLEILQDPTRELTIEDVSTTSEPHNFIPSQQEVPNFGFSDKVVWVRFVVRNATTSQSNWYLELEHPFISLAELYAPSQNRESYEVIKGGQSLPFVEPETYHHNVLFGLSLPPTVEETFYLRLESETSMTLPLKLWQPRAFAETNRVQQLIWGAIYSVLLTVVCYFAFLYFSLEDRTYLYIAFFSVALIFVGVTYDGRLYQFAQSVPSLITRLFALELAIAIAIIFMLLSSRAYLLVRDRSVELDLIFTLLMVSVAVSLLVGLLLGTQVGMAFLLLLAGCALLLVGVATLVTWLRGFSPAKLFALAFAVPLCMGLMAIIARFGLVSNQLFSPIFPIAISAVAILLLSFTVAYRSSFLQAETAASISAESRDREQLRQYLGSLPFGVITFDSQLNVTYINHAIRQFAHDLDISMDELIGEHKAFGMLNATGKSGVRPAHHVATKRAFQGVSSTTDDVDLELTDWSMPQEVSASSMAAEGVEIEFVLSVFRDLREQLKRERVRNESEARLANILENSTDAIISIDQAQRISHANRGAQQVFGYSFEELLGQPIDMLLPQMFRQVHRKHVEEFMAVEEGASTDAIKMPIEMKGRRKNGEIFPAEVAITKLTFDEQTFYTAFLRDISDRRLAEKIEREAIIAERNRLARELHDSVTHTLFSAGLIAEALPIQWRSDRQGAIANLNRLQNLTRGALAEMRTLLLELRPNALTSTSLWELLENLAQTSRAQRSITVDFRADVTWDGELPADVQIAFYRVAQEALNNVGKHAAADQVTMQLIYSARFVEIRVADDGKGFEPDNIAAGHIGIRIMGERAKEIGATLDFESQLGIGTHLRLYWPNYLGDQGNE